MAFTSIVSSQIVTGEVVISGTQHIVNGGVANSTTINTGGFLGSDGRQDVEDGGVANSTTINFGGRQIVSSGGTANSTTINDGRQDVLNDGVANKTILNFNCYQCVSSGGVANYTTINSGGEQFVLNDGMANFTTISSGGVVNFWVEIPMGFGEFESGYANVINQQAGGAIIADTTATITGGTNTRTDGHSAFSIVSGVASNFLLENDGKLYVETGNSATDTLIASGGEQHVEYGGVANSTTINSGGYQCVFSGVANNTTLNTGGVLDVGVFYGATANVINQQAGGGIRTNTNATITSGTNTRTDGHSAFSIVSGGASNFLLENGGELYVWSGHSATDTLIASDGFQYVTDGGVANKTILNSYGYQGVSSGGVANYTTINSGGELRVLSGGSANVINQQSGGGICANTSATITHGTNTRTDGHSAFFIVSGVASNFLLEGGELTVWSGHSAIDTVIASGGIQYVASGGIANSTTINGGSQSVEGVANSTFINSGGEQWVSGTANSTAIDSGGIQYVEYCGVVNSVTINGGQQNIHYGGMAITTIVNFGGEQYVASGGTANITTVNSGGSQSICGVASSTTVNSGGSQYVSFGGTAAVTTVGIGGTQYVASGGTVTGDLTEAGGHTILESANAMQADSVAFQSLSSYSKVATISIDSGSLSDTGCLWELNLDHISSGQYALVSGPDLSALNHASFTVNYQGQSRTGLAAGANYTFADGSRITWSILDSEQKDTMFASFSLVTDVVPAVVSVVATDNFASESGDTAVFRVSRTGDTSAALKVYFTTSGMSIQNLDYTLSAGTELLDHSVAIAAGQSYVDITLSAVNDAMVESARLAVLALTPNSAYDLNTFSSRSAEVNIASDDTVPVYQFTDGVPLIKFPPWDQDSGYNKYCPIDQDTGKRAVTGCGPTALAQLLYYWHYSISVSPDRQYVLPYDPETCIVGDDQSAKTCGFLPLSQLNAKLANLKFDGSVDEAATMSFAVGIELEAAFTSISTSTFVKQALATGFHSWNLTCSDSPDIIYELRNGRPLVAFLDSVEAGGHVALIDGYREADDKYHFNLGWGGNNNGWYSMSNIPTSIGTFCVSDCLSLYPSDQERDLTVNSNIDFSVSNLKMLDGNNNVVTTCSTGDIPASISIDCSSGDSNNSYEQKFAKVEVFLSRDRTITAEDISLGFLTGYLFSSYGTDSLDLYNYDYLTYKLVVPKTIAAGNYYLGAHLVTAGDSDDTNNWTVGDVIIVEGAPDKAPPTVPAKLAASVNGNAVTFSWKASTDALSGISQYEYQIDDNNDFPSLTKSGTAAGTSVNTSDLAAGTDYFWRVRAQDNAGNYSAWSKSASFFVAPEDTAANDYKTAKNISAGVDSWVGYGDAADCYKLTLTSAGMLTLSLTGLSGNADLSLLSAAGKVLKTSANKDIASEAINDLALLGGDYYIKVTLAKGVTSADYTLSNKVDYFPGDNAGNTPDKANDIGELEDGVVVECSDWTGFGDPADYYRLTLTNAGTLSQNLTGLFGDANLTLLNSAGKVLKTSANKKTADEAITTPLLAGDYLVKVAPADGGKSIVNNTAYTLSNVVNYFPDDNAGNTPAGANVIGELADGVAVERHDWAGFGDPADYYQLTLTAAGALSLNLTGLSGDANLTLLNSAGKVLQTSANKKNAAEFISTALATGDYFVKVASADGGKGIVNNTYYNLSNYFQEETAGSSFATAVELNSDETVHGWVGGGNKEDYYKFEALADGATSSGDLSGFTSNVNLYIYDFRHKLVASSTKSGLTPEAIDSGIGNIDAGTYYVKVMLAGTGATEYDLNFNLDQGGLRLSSAAAPLSSSADTGGSDPLKKSNGLLAS